MSTRARRVGSAAVVALLVILAAAPGQAATRYDWRLRFRTIRTPHFDIHVHQGEDALAARLARIAEDVYEAMRHTLGVPAARVQVILVDQSDLSNGWATPVPYDVVEITAAPPAPESLIGNTDDWLRLVFTHEYTHIVHLDRSRGWIAGVRRIFGRVPVAFPNVFLPGWQVEGLATFNESRLTGEGRVPAGDFRALVDVGASHHRFEPRDRVSGGLDDWPSGNAVYAYGAYFHQYLADRYGADRFAALADATSGRIPFLSAPAFRRVFGRSLGGLWTDFRAEHERLRPGNSRTDAEATRLTRDGFIVNAARYDEDGRLYYATRNADGFPALWQMSSRGAPRRLAWRYLGNRTSVRGGWIVFDQIDRVRSTALYSDLYGVHPDGGTGRRLTRAARAADPDLSPDGRFIACTVEIDGRHALATMPFEPEHVSSPKILLDEPDSDFTGPRWSPDGGSLAVERRRLHEGYEIAIVDAVSGQIHPIVRSAVRVVTPSWTLDGRYVLFAATAASGAFNVYAVEVATGSIARVTDSVSGAQAPELSPDGRTLTFVGYTVDGYDLFSIPVNPGAWEPAVLLPPEARATAGEMPFPGVGPYRPWRTLVPTYWSPVVATDAGELLVGADTAMTDTLGRHTYAVDAAWSDARTRPDWHALYAYDRWWPTLFTSVSEDTDPVRGGTVRERELLAGAVLPFRHVRWTETLMGAFDLDDDRLQCDGGCLESRTTRRRSLRGGWMHDSRREFGYSISTDEGAAIKTAVESSRTLFGADADAGAAVVDGRVFHRVLGRHTVLAARAALAAGWGDRGARRRFSAAGPGPALATFDFGTDAIGLLRGVASDAVVGSRAAVANLDLRFPLARPQRGPGGWPVFLRAVHGAVFVDAGSAWDARFRRADLRTSAGSEISIDVILAHYLPLTFSGGAAWTRDPVADRNRAAAFGRIGHAF